MNLLTHFRVGKLDQICDLIVEIGHDMDDKHSVELLTLMKEYRTKYHMTFRGLYRIPGFKKIWDALEEAALMNIRMDKDEYLKQDTFVRTYA